MLSSLIQSIIAIFDAVARDIGVVALLLTSCLIVLNVNKDAFEISSVPKVVMTPLGPPYSATRWRYESDEAEECRILVGTYVLAFHLIIIGLFVVMVTTLVIHAAFCAAAADPFPQDQWHAWGQWWVAHVDITMAWAGEVKLTVALAGAPMIYNLSRIVFLCTQAKRNPPPLP